MCGHLPTLVRAHSTFGLALSMGLFCFPLALPGLAGKVNKLVRHFGVFPSGLKQKVQRRVCIAATFTPRMQEAKQQLVGVWHKPPPGRGYFLLSQVEPSNYGSLLLFL